MGHRKKVKVQGEKTHKKEKRKMCALVQTGKGVDVRLEGWKMR